MSLQNLTRPQWGGPQSDVDIHIEEHLGIVDGSFLAESQFAKYMNIRTLQGTNIIRLDRVGATEVKGRKVGEALEPTPVRNDKLNLVVDTTLYVRHEFDYFDLWTANPDLRREIAAEDGLALATQFDSACIGQLQKCADFKAPDHLKGAFHDGILLELDIATGTAKANAEKLVQTHRQGLEQMIRRNLGNRVRSEGVTLVSPEVFSILLEHDKLMNVQFGADAANSFVGGRVGYMNGIPVIESARFALEASTDNPLGADHNLTADEIKRQMITFIPSIALVGAQVQSITSRYYEEKYDFKWVLDTYQAYNIGQRRPDAVAVVAVAM